MVKTKAKIKFTSRPPVVSILGHIDHGKTTLLDNIRKSKLASAEAGGITQDIGAYQIEYKGRKITFIDTPGHAAFAKMRARGAEVTDLAILVIAADEGVKPQTRESLKFIQQAQIPFIVAANKIDLPASSIEKVSQDLAKEGILVEKKGGEVVLVPVSAKTGEGVEDLLEMILLITDMQDIKSDPEAQFKGIIIESKLERLRGPLATILVKEGTLSITDFIWTEGACAKVKAMYDETGQRVTKAFPSKPVSVLGFDSVPPVGATVIRVAGKIKSPQLPRQKIAQSTEKTEEEEHKKVKLVLKADTQGTLEAIRMNLSSEVELIHQGVGDINEGDIFLTQTAGASLVGFSVRIPPRIKKLASVEKVPIKIYKIIYELLKDIDRKVLKILEPTIDEEILGEAEVIKEFLINDKKIAGCRVLKGRIVRGDQLHLRRNEKILDGCRVNSLHKGKSEVEKAVANDVFGMGFSPQLDFTVGDVLVSFRKLPQKE
ncbi:MAG TPA: translation initiation factor IF-2 [Candidatus Bathyarchaeia archaeon]|nr:translation initiation factor IF-2 [Candidatus Bathyarchaeia archaeon]